MRPLSIARHGVRARQRLSPAADNDLASSDFRDRSYVRVPARNPAQVARKRKTDEKRLLKTFS